ncbi:ABC transporter permease [Paenibacillus sp. R14(2021)]|uniref:ABC transporter permease n=1 Tax=Paenibacillus sp. R14(2021) TaxID=2859228 RepID=UPI001C612F58|nr:ABC-2 family transporter protein [Paenibacillus sp. R14(2021)]
MAAAFKHYGSVAACFMRLTIQRQLEYPLFLVSWLVMIPIQYFSGIWVLQMILSRFHTLGGWEFPELTFIFGLSLLSHGLLVVFFINTWHMDNMVINGGFDRLLLRPLNVFFQLISSYFNFIGLIDLIPGTIIFLYGCSQIGFEWSLVNICKLILVVIGGVLIRASLFICLGTIAFWTKRSASLVGFALSMLERGAMYPLTIYPYAIQVLFTFLIPIGFISFYPAVEFTGKTSGFHIPFDLALWTPVIGIVCFVLSQQLFKLGLKNYESAGS